MRDIGKINSQLYRNSKIYFANDFKELGILAGQFMFVLCICENPGKSQDWIAEELKINKSTVARVIVELINQGLVRMEVDKIDKRIHILYPTEKCLNLYPKVKKKLRQYNKIALEGLTTEEKEKFEKIFQRINRNIAKEIENRRKN